MIDDTVTKTKTTKNKNKNTKNSVYKAFLIHFYLYTSQPSQIDPEVMTPLTSYIIYYGRKTEDLDLLLSEVVQVSDGRREEVSEYTMTGVIMGGEVKVGVAAVNSAGASHVAYYQHTVGKSLPSIALYVCMCT